MEKTYYEKFGLKETATALDIKKAYRKLAFKYHPDQNGGDKKAENVFKEVNNIYKTLSDVDSRRKYDSELKKLRDAEKQYSSTNQEYQNQHKYQRTYTSPKQETNYASRHKACGTQKESSNKNYNGFVILAIIGIILFGIYYSSSTSNNSGGIDSPNKENNSDSFYNNNSSQSTGEINFGNSTTKNIFSKDTVTFVPSNAKRYKKKRASSENIELKNSKSTGEIKFKNP
jgi:curved DNA-binding protein CbpA